MSELKPPLRSIGLALVSIAISPPMAQAKDDDPKTYTGFVSGLDVRAEPDKPIACYASVSKGMVAGPEQIQIVTYEQRLQSILEVAVIRGTQVEVTYVIKDGHNTVTRVRMLVGSTPERKANK